MRPMPTRDLLGGWSSALYWWIYTAHETHTSCTRWHAAHAADEADAADATRTERHTHS